MALDATDQKPGKPLYPPGICNTVVLTPTTHQPRTADEPFFSGLGCASQALRDSDPEFEIFGMWFGYFVDRDQRLYFVDVQQDGLVTASLPEMIRTLHWSEGHLPDLFFSPLR